MSGISPNLRFRLVEVFFPKCSFECKFANDLEIEQKAFNIEFKPEGIINNEKKTFLLTLSVSIKEQNESFIGNFVAMGHFEFAPETIIETKESLDNYFYTNAPALVFPYIRAFIANMTAQSGFATVHIPTYNLTSIKDQLKDNIVIE